MSKKSRNKPRQEEPKPAQRQEPEIKPVEKKDNEVFGIASCEGIYEFIKKRKEENK